MSESRLTFFRQSGWLLIASNVGSGLMWLVHTVARRMEADEYSLMTTLFQSLLLVGSVGGAVQTIFAQQAAAAVTDRARGELSAAVRKVTAALVGLWGAGAVVTFVLAGKISGDLRIGNPAALWMAVVFALGQLLLPVSSGVLQGRQDFLWLGWTGILNGAVRLGTIGFLVVVLGGQAASGLTGAVLGMVVAGAFITWHCRDVWTGPKAAFDWADWLRWAGPLALGFGATTFVLTADIIHVRRVFSGEHSAYYNAAGMIGRALAMFTAPLTAVMFPKVAAAAARSEKTNALAVALGATALLGACAAIACTLLPELPIRLVQGEKYLPAAKLIPQFAWCIQPVTLATVLVNSLLARRRFGVVPGLLVVAVGYAAALHFFGTTPERVIYILGAAGTALLGVAAWFTWRK